MKAAERVTRYPSESLGELEARGLVSLGRGKVISKHDLAATPGTYPVYSSAKDNDGKFGEYGHFMFDEELITWSIDGGGRLFHRHEHRFSVTNVGGTLRVNRTDKLDCRFLFFMLSYLHSIVVFDWVQKAHPSVIRKVYDTVPLPPLEEQRRIVAVLDQAFAAIATATANAKKNLANAHELFAGYLASVFRTDEVNPNFAEPAPETIGSGSKVKSKRTKEQTSTGGREATTRPIQGRRALGVGPQRSLPPKGWQWQSLMSLARLESGHTPSRSRSSYWGGSIPWIGIRDAKANDGEVIRETLENVTEKGIAGSSARVLPGGTVCLSRTASVGYVVVMGRDMATSQDFLNFICTDAILPEFLQLLFLAQGDDIFRFSSGAVHQTIYYPEAKAFSACIPPVTTQREIVRQAKALKESSEALEAKYRAKIAELASLKESLLHRAFTGELTTAMLETIAA